MSTSFGTDGIRGIANSQLTPEIALALGRVAARRLDGRVFLVGRDTRRSGPMLLAAVSAGVCAEGCDVVDLGVLSTPGLAWLGAARNLPVIVVSASHNPFDDNGIKIFGPGGAKLSSEVEHEIEVELAGLLDGSPEGERPVPVGDAVGTVSTDDRAADDYLDALAESVSIPTGTGLRIVVDCANGAASALAPRLYSRFGLDVRYIADMPDGTNINDRCGATSPDQLARAVVLEHADLGLSFDGDADRLIACDSQGTIVDGDVLLALFAFDLDDRRLLENRKVVATVMSNLGLKRALRTRGIELVETDVGDRNVTDAMDATGASLGGEQSGHIVFRRESLIGDGMFSGLKLIELVAGSGRSLEVLAKEVMTRLPQVVRNVAVCDPRRLEERPAIFAAARQIESTLGEWGRIFIRASGTEPKVRVLVEAEDEERVVAVADELCGVVEREMARG